MKIEVGKYYKTRDGRKVGPISFSPYGDSWLTAPGFCDDHWYSGLNNVYSHREGFVCTDITDFDDLVEEWKGPEEMKYNDGKWHPWTGGECPVHPKTEVEFLLGSGYKGENKAEYTQFSREAGSDIIAFRVVKEYKEPREYWISIANNYHTVHSVKPQFYIGELVHVREVSDV